MATVRLTDASIRKIIADAATAGRAELTDATTTGLKIRATRDGRAVWSIKLRDMTGKQIRINLGEYPVVGISDARREAAAARHKVRQEGVNPNVEKKAARVAARTPAAPPVPEMTLAALLVKYGEHVGAERKTWGDAHLRIRSVFGSVLTRDLKTVTRAELQIVADNWPSKSSASAAVRYLRPVIKWGAVRDYAPIELTTIQQTRPAGRRDRFLSRDELDKLLPVLRASDRPHAAVMLLLLLTATRLEQASLARWNEFGIVDGQMIWTIPPERVKRTKPNQTPKPHIIPLSRQAAALIESKRRETSQPGDLVFPTSSGLPVGNWDKETKAIRRAAGVEGWHRHDLRRTAATSMGALGIAPHVIEAALGHAEIHSSLAGVYNRSRYTAEVGAALQDLGDWVESVWSA